MKKENGFTLVELAIVLMVIGLLIGGVLRGQELMNNARISRTIAQVKAYQGALTSFRDMYGNYPGDMNNAMARIPNCTATNNCANGNGDGMVGTPMIIWNNQTEVIGSETVQFWKHLALAHLITGINPATASLASGQSHPASPLGGVFVAVQGNTSGSTDPAAYDGFVVRIQAAINNSPENNPAVTPHDAGQVDRKMDDGIPARGGVRSSSTTGPDPTNACEGKYNEAVETKSCVLYFMM